MIPQKLHSVLISLQSSAWCPFSHILDPFLLGMEISRAVAPGVSVWNLLFLFNSGSFYNFHYRFIRCTVALATLADSSTSVAISTARLKVSSSSGILNSDLGTASLSTEHINLFLNASSSVSSILGKSHIGAVFEFGCLFSSVQNLNLSLTMNLLGLKFWIITAWISEKSNLLTSHGSFLWSRSLQELVNWSRLICEENLCNFCRRNWICFYKGLKITHVITKLVGSKSPFVVKTFPET